jgi:hypothetical protein
MSVPFQLSQSKRKLTLRAQLDWKEFWMINDATLMGSFLLRNDLWQRPTEGSFKFQKVQKTGFFSFSDLVTVSDGKQGDQMGF